MSLTKIVKGMASGIVGIAMLSCGEMRPEVSQPESSNPAVTPVVKQEVSVRKPVKEVKTTLPGFDCYTIDEKGIIIPEFKQIPGYVCMAPFYVEKNALTLINPLIEKTRLSSYMLLTAVDEDGDLIVSYQELHNFANIRKFN